MGSCECVSCRWVWLAGSARGGRGRAGKGREGRLTLVPHPASTATWCGLIGSWKSTMRAQTCNIGRVALSFVTLRIFQRSGLKLDKDLKFFRISSKCVYVW